MGGVFGAGHPVPLISQWSSRPCAFHVFLTFFVHCAAPHPTNLTESAPAPRSWGRADHPFLRSLPPSPFPPRYTFASVFVNPFAMLFRFRFPAPRPGVLFSFFLLVVFFLELFWTGFPFFLHPESRSQSALEPSGVTFRGLFPLGGSPLACRSNYVIFPLSFLLVPHSFSISCSNVSPVFLTLNRLSLL